MDYIKEQKKIIKEEKKRFELEQKRLRNEEKKRKRIKMKSFDKAKIFTAGTIFIGAALTVKIIILLVRLGITFNNKNIYSNENKVNQNFNYIYSCDFITEKKTIYISPEVSINVELLNEKYNESETDIFKKYNCGIISFNDNENYEIIYHNIEVITDKNQSIKLELENIDMSKTSSLRKMVYDQIDIDNDVNSFKIILQISVLGTDIKNKYYTQEWKRINIS